MHRWFVIFMLFILPVRGFVGDAMAYSMLPAQMPSPVATQAVINTLAQDDMVMHMGNAVSVKMPCHDVSGSEQQDDKVSYTPQCTSCQVCHLTATTAFQAVPSLLQPAAAIPAQQAPLWHSAELRLSIKPPVL